MSRAVVLAAVRTPVGRYGGALADVRPDDLAATAIAAAVERSGVDPAEIEDVYFGAANQAGEDNRNVARMAGRRPARVGRRRHAQPALRLGALGRRLRVSCRRGR
jgi:acetyl-CoA acetyltransferase